MEIVNSQDKLIKAEILKGLKKFAIPCDDLQVEQLAGYLRLMSKWNKVHNLTRVPEEAWVQRHLIDSLTLFGHVSEASNIDVGTGAGLPGIPLAIMKPTQHWTLLDSSNKRISFLKQVVIDLKLKNVTPVCMRVENYKPSVKFNNILTRAFASLADMITATEHLCAENGQFLAMKANLSDDELKEVVSPFQVKSIVTLPIEPQTRQLVIITRTL